MKLTIEIQHANGARMAGLADGCAGLVLTSPPYFPDEVEAELRRGSPPEPRVDALRTTIENFAWSLRPVFTEAERVLVAGGRFILQTRDVRLDRTLVPVEHIHRTIAESLGLSLFTRHFWRPARISPRRRAAMRALEHRAGPMTMDPEVFLVFHKPGAERPCAAPPEHAQLLRLDAICDHSARLRAIHRFQSPLHVLTALIHCHSREGDLVVDPFAGGGATLVTAYRSGRSAFGCEIDPSAYALGATNCEQARGFPA